MMHEKKNSLKHRYKKLNNPYSPKHMDLIIQLMTDDELKTVKTKNVFGKSGLYLDRKENKSWLEFGGDFALKDSVESFKRHLDLANAQELKSEEIEALKLIYKTSLATPKLRKMYYIWREAQELKKLRTDMKLYVQRVKKDQQKTNQKGKLKYER